MISELLKRSYDQSLEVKVKLKTIDTPFIGLVVGGSRFFGGSTVDFISSDGFFSYTFKVISDYDLKPSEVARGGFITIPVTDIENVEVLE